MKKHVQKKSSKHLLWPLFILLFLTIGVFFTTREVPKQQEIRSHAQDFSTPVPNTPTPTPTPVLVGVNTTLNIAFSLPGNLTGGNVNPVHKTRNIVVNLYDTDTNSDDPASIPLFSFQSTATFDNNPQSP